MVNSFIFKMCNNDPVIFLIVILFVIKKVMTIYLFDNNDLNGVHIKKEGINNLSSNLRVSLLLIYLNINFLL
jgi:hypothetical protein